MTEPTLLSLNSGPHEIRPCPRCGQDFPFPIDEGDLCGPCEEIDREYKDDLMAGMQEPWDIL